MVLVSIKEQDNIKSYIDNIEKQLRMLRFRLNHIAEESNRKGYLQVGEYVKVGKRSSIPNEEPTLVLECGKIVDVQYCIKSVKIKYLFDTGEFQEKPVKMIKEFHLDNDDNFIVRTIPRPVGVNLDDDESDDEDDDVNEESSEDERCSELENISNSD